MADRDRATEWVDPRVVVGDAEVVQEGEDLDGKGFVDLEHADVVDGQASLASAFCVDGTGPTPITSGSHPANAKETNRIASCSSPAHRRPPRRQQIAPVAPSFSPAAVAGSDPTVRSEWRLQRASPSAVVSGRGPLIDCCQPVALLGCPRRDHWYEIG